MDPFLPGSDPHAELPFELRLRLQFLEQTPSVVYVVDAAFSAPARVSGELENLLGYTPDEWTAVPDLWERSLHPGDRERVARAAGEAAARLDTEWDQEYRLVAKDGSAVWVHDRARVILDDQGRRSYWQGAVIDVTATKEAETALRESEAKYRALVENIPAVVYTIAPDGDGSTLYVNPQVEQMLGYTREEWLDQPDIWMEILHPEDRETTLDAHDRHNETGEPWSREYRLIASDGRVVWFRDEATLVRDVDGRPLFWQGVRLDITAQKEAESALQRAHDDLERRVKARTSELEEANELMMLEVHDRRLTEAKLREAEERYRLLVEHQPAVAYVWEVDPDRRRPQYYTSPKLERMLGFSIEEYEADDNFWISRVHPHDRDRVVAASMRTEATGDPFSQEYRFLASDGHIVWVHDEAELLTRDAQGKPKLLHGIMVDITEHREAAERLRRAEARAAMIADHLPAVTYLWQRGDRPGELGPAAYISPKLEELLGYRPQDWLRSEDAWREALHPDDREHVASLPDLTDTVGANWSFEYRLIAANGRIVWVRDVGTSVASEESGQHPVLNGILIDVTNARESVRRLEEAESLYRTLVEQIPAVTVIAKVDPKRKYRIVFVSPQSDAILGYRPDELIGAAQPVSGLIHPDDTQAYFEEAERARELGHFSHTCRVVRKDGTSLLVQISGTLVPDPEGRPAFWHGVLLDLSQRDRPDETLRLMEEQLEGSGSGD
jgi:PAS domain S-box-containing protein